MAMADIKAFYELLAVDQALAKEASSFQERFSTQEEVIEAFISLGGSRGFVFTENELISWIFKNGTEVKE